MDPIDAVDFANTHINELKTRFAHINDKDDYLNFGKTPEEVVQKFINDQGLDFKNIDIPAIVALGSK